MICFRKCANCHENEDHEHCTYKEACKHLEIG
jgi:hypothetical protein